MYNYIVSTKLQHRVSDGRVTLFLSLLVAAGQWQSAMSTSMPLQMVQVQNMADAFQSGSGTTEVGPPAKTLALHVRSQVRKGFHPFAERHDVLLQRNARVFRRRGDPRNIEEMPTYMGVPKLVWVILADVVGMGIFFSCIGLVIMYARSPKDDMNEVEELHRQETIKANNLLLQYHSYPPTEPIAYHSPTGGSGPIGSSTIGGNSRTPTFTGSIPYHVN